jgi:CRP/FNR family transcriptional regulator, nitrogen fixation regulation protein
MIAHKNYSAKKAVLFGRRQDMLGVSLTYQPNQEIYGEGEPAKRFYQVLRGVVRTHLLLDDGRRQVAGFYFEGDIFGLELVENHDTSSEAVMTSRVAAFRRDRIIAAASQSIEVARELWARAATNLHHAERHLLLLGRKTAMEKVEDFLIEMEQRSSRAGHINLPMTRLDIADYLGLTVETVSRVLGQMQEDGRLSLSGARKVTLRQSTMMPVSPISPCNVS